MLKTRRLELPSALLPISPSVSPPPKVGTVVGFTAENVCVKFKAGVFQLSPDAIAIVDQSELFEVGDAVTLPEDAELEGVEVYPGMVGLCLEPDDEGWKVKFGREEVVVPTEQLLLAGKGFETSKGSSPTHPTTRVLTMMPRREEWDPGGGLGAVAEDQRRGPIRHLWECDQVRRRTGAACKALCSP